MRWPAFSDRTSVASPSSLASGIMAKADVANTMISFESAHWAIREIGMKSNSNFRARMNTILVRLFSWRTFAISMGY